MKSFRLVNVVVAVLMLLALLPAPQQAQAAPAFEIAPDALYVPGEVVVSFADGLSASAVTSRANALAGQVGAQVAGQHYNLALLSFGEGADVEALVNQINATGLVQAAQPNYIHWIPEKDGSMIEPEVAVEKTYSVTARDKTTTFTSTQLAAMRRIIKKDGRSQSVPMFPNEFTYPGTNTWGFDTVNAEIIYPSTKASPQVCIIDTGADINHVDLKGKVLNGYDFANADTLSNDDNGHGTHVAGIIVARGNNGAASALGVSNGTALAVKALNAQGWGTTFAIVGAIRYCAAATSVRVINMSLGGGYPDPLEYDALQYAIVTKNRLVVAAAGNEYSSSLSFPAAWALENIKKDGSYAATGSDNTIHKGMISVAAARINPPTLPVWIDINNDGIWNEDYYDPDLNPEGESFEADDCAAQFSNYGRTVTLVAPGHAIYSTTPTSYPFYEGFYYGSPAGYDTWSGTSMATPFVAGAAARVLSVKALSNTTSPTLKEQLVETGRDLTYAVDPFEVTTENPFDAANAYLNDGFGPVDEDSDGYYDYIKAPFCWPADANTAPVTNGENPFGAEQDMSNARYLDVARAMDRLALVTYVGDASSGVPLTGASVRVFSGATTYDTSLLTSTTSPVVLLLNIPNDDRVYSLQVNKAGYTYGSITYDTFNPLGDGVFMPGEYNMTTFGSVYVPPKANMTAVLEWGGGYDLDLYVWLPPNPATPAGAEGIVSPGWMPYYQPRFPAELDWGFGTLLAPAQFGGTVSPYTMLMHDGGTAALYADDIPMDSVAIKTGYYGTFYYKGNYTVMVTDYSLAYSPTTGQKIDCGALPLNQLGCLDNNLVSDGDPYTIVRLWYGGKILSSSKLAAMPPESNCASTDAPHDWWKVMAIKGKIATGARLCGTASNGAADYVLPYPNPLP